MTYNQLPSSLNSTWREVFSALQEPPTYTLRDKPTEIQQKDAIRVQLIWNLALHWVIKKKWQSSYRIPYPRKVAKVIEPWGTLLYQYLELCIECHGHLKPNPYSTSATWFWAIVRESQRNSIFRPINTSKTESLKIRREMVQCMREFTNPISKQEAPHEWLLIETAINLGNAEFFDKDYYKPFIKAYSAWLSSVKSSDWLAVIRESNKLYLQAGKGKGKILLDFRA